MCTLFYIIQSTGAYYVRVDPCSTSQGGIEFVTEERKVDIDYIEKNSIDQLSIPSPFIDEERSHAQSFDDRLGGSDLLWSIITEKNGGIITIKTDRIQSARSI